MSRTEPVIRERDVVVVGAGFSGLYLLYRLRSLGFSVTAFEMADDLGGTWYWNRYPGARCDIPTTDYTYSFDAQLESEWQWTEKYATQPEILRYLEHVADRHDLRRDIEFSTRVEAATWNEASARWEIRTDKGELVHCRFLVMAAGCLSVPKTPDIEGVERFGGEVYLTGRWPHEPVDFTGKRVAVIGTGSSGIQCIPLIAETATQVTVFQRTANFSIPAHNGPVPQERLEAIAKDRDAYRRDARNSRGGVPFEPTMIFGITAPDDVRRERFEEAWEAGELFAILNVFADQAFNPTSNDIVATMLREKIQAIVEDADVIDDLSPTSYPFGTKRPCLDTNYFETFNRPHVRLINLKKHPIVSVTETGVDTDNESIPFDVIVYATGFDAMTGPLLSVDIRGKSALALKDKWVEGPSTYLGLTTTGFPNFFTVTGPGSPSVLSNMVVSIEQHVDWIGDCLTHMSQHDLDTIEPTPTAEAGWNQHVQDCADITLYPRANSWYMGANVPGKPRVFLAYIGGVDRYRATCDEVVERGYLGFEFSSPAGLLSNDGVIRRLQPDVAVVLDTLAELGIPPLESIGVEGARMFLDLSATGRPPGPQVGEVVDSDFTGPGGPVEYRLYRPSSEGPHPAVVYFHGGGWTLGGKDSDDPLCRDLCDRSDCIVISVNYRHAPETPFPAAIDDARAAVQWVADNAEQLGALPGRLAVCGWSAGANLAAVVCQLARNEGGPVILGQVLLCPVTDSNLDRPSYRENGEQYFLTRSLMSWFWDNYASGIDRTNTKLSPLRGDLTNLPPAFIVTAEFDPLRDEGLAYAEALTQAGVPTRYVEARGQVHTSIPMVDIVVSGASYRAQMASALKAFLSEGAERPRTDHQIDLVTQ
jgi:cation diffusion facilitator CzcD-associated flavoprotein CzcO/acetyl esterase/lipase